MISMLLQFKKCKCNWWKLYRNILSAKWGTSLNMMFLLTFETYWKLSFFFFVTFWCHAIQFSDWNALVGFSLGRIYSFLLQLHVFFVAQFIFSFTQLELPCSWTHCNPQLQCAVDQTLSLLDVLHFLPSSCNHLRAFFLLNVDFFFICNKEYGKILN